MIKPYPMRMQRQLTFVRCVDLIFVSMKISDEVREFAKQKGLDSKEAIEMGMQDKAKEFVEKAEIYSS